MRYNEKELMVIANGNADKEGRLHHRCPGFRETYKERWFKLRGNLLFYFRLNEYGAVYEKEPVGVLVVENCRVQHEPYSDLPFAFSITFADELDKRHYFSCITQRHCDNWINLIREASYEYQREKLHRIQSKILELTGTDPLASFRSECEVKFPKQDLLVAPKRPPRNVKKVSGAASVSMFWGEELSSNDIKQKWEFAHPEGAVSK